MSPPPGPEEAPLSRKQRLMAAVEEEERGRASTNALGSSPPPPPPSRSPDPLLRCFVCGGGIRRGKELRLQVQAPRGSSSPFFPFLRHQDPAPGAQAVSGEGFALVCAVCRCFLTEQWDAFERSRTPVEKRLYWLKRPHQGEAGPPGGPSAGPQDWDFEGGEEEEEEEEKETPFLDSELSSLSETEPPWEEPWGRERKVGPTQGPTQGPQDKKEKKKPHLLFSRDGGRGRSQEESEEVDIADNKAMNGSRYPPLPSLPSTSEVACYVCGTLLPPGARHQLHVQKQEQASGAPFFPFLWLHTPPPGALPISPATGTTIACAACAASLAQQWQGFQAAGVPVLQRLYVVPLDPAAKPSTTATPRQEACYLCGEEYAAEEGRPVPAKVPNGDAEGTMHFPFLRLLPCPPNAKGPDKRWEVRSCPKCFGVLRDLWAMYRASRNEDFITSVQSFLGRYHRVFASTDTVIPARHSVLAKPGPASICYICGAELGPSPSSKECQLSVNPPGRFGEKEPFFPFLTVYPPAPRARPADSTGIVSACVLCHHDLLGQWLQYESSHVPHPSSPWSRQYKVETFVCFFCRQERKRCLGLKAVEVARLPVFLCSFRAPGSLLVDDGKRLTIGACPECAALVLAGKAAVPQDLQKAPAAFPLEAPALKLAASEATPRTSEATAPGNGPIQDHRAGLDVESPAQTATSKTLRMLL